MGMPIMIQYALTFGMLSSSKRETETILRSSAPVVNRNPRRSNTVFERRGFKFTTGADDLKMIAVSRLILDNIPNVKAYWIMMGLQMAQVALHFGANDVQGTVVREQIFQAAGATSGTEQKVEELVRVIKDAGRVPVQRDTLYNHLRAW